jgi:stress-induced morphogen
MAIITRGRRDKYVKRIKEVLDEYEAEHPGAVASLYRQNSASIRVRIIDERFENVSKSKRHDKVFKFLSDRLEDDEIQEISVLLPLAPDELKSTFMNLEFDDPMPSRL